MAAPIEVLFSSDASGLTCNTHVWDTNTGTSLTEYKGGTTESHGLCLAGDGYLFGAATGKQFISVWALHRKDQMQMKMVCPGKVTSLECSPDGTFCVAGIDEKIHAWQLSTGNLLAVLRAHYQTVNCLKFTDDGSHFVSAGNDGLILIWSLPRILSQFDDVHSKPEPVFKWTGHSLPITGLHIGIGGIQSRIISSSLDQTCKLWDMASRELLCTFTFDASVLCVTMDAAECRMFAGCRNGKVFVVNMYGEPIRRERHVGETGDKAVSCLIGHSKQVTCLSISMDGMKLASGSHDLSVKLWDVFSGQCMRTFQHKGAITNVLITLCPPGIRNRECKAQMPLEPFKRQLHSSSLEDTNHSSLDVRIHKIDKMEVQVREENDVREYAEWFQKINRDEENMTEVTDKLTQLTNQVEILKQRNSELYNFAVENTVH